MDHGRDPCPWVVLNDFGGAFCMGVRTLCLSTMSLPKDNPIENLREARFRHR
jgi:hypothetical protein